MDKTKLKQELIELHEELGQVVSQHEQLDGKMIQALRQVADDIDRVLSEQASGTGATEAGASETGADGRSEVAAASPSVSAPSPQTLEELAEQFSVDHPKTAALLSRLGYLLSNLGI